MPFLAWIGTVEKIKKYVGIIVIATKNMKRAEKPQDEERKRKSLRKLFLIGAVSVIIVLVVILTLLTLDSVPPPAPPQLTPTQPQTPTTESAPAPTPDVTPVPPEIEKGLLILSHTTYVDKYGYFHLIGEVENLSEHGTEHNQVRADFYDEQGTIYSTGTGECFRELIGPSGKSPFEIVLSEAPETLTYKLTTLSRPTKNLPTGEFSLTEISPESGVDSEYIVKGMIHNDSDHDIETALILGTFYDNYGNVTAVGFTFPDIVPIQPGGSSEFTMTVDFHRNPIVSFTLHTETSP